MGMYSNTSTLDMSPQFYFSGHRPDLSFNKGQQVTIKEDWQVLLQNVSSKGCRQSFRKIFDHFFPLLVAQGTRSGLKKEIAVELAQETMIKVWGQSSTFEPVKGNASVWIYTISRNLRYDYFRSHKNDPLKAASSNVYLFDEDEVGNAQDLEHSVDAGILKQHLTVLPKEQKDVIEKIYLEGFTQEEVSKTYNIPLGTVKSRVRLGIAAIKEKFGDEIK